MPLSSKMIVPSVGKKKDYIYSTFIFIVQMYIYTYMYAYSTFYKDIFSTFYLELGKLGF